MKKSLILYLLALVSFGIVLIYRNNAIVLWSALIIAFLLIITASIIENMEKKKITKKLENDEKEYTKEIYQYLEENSNMSGATRLIYDVYKKEDTPLNSLLKRYGLLAMIDYSDEDDEGLSVTFTNLEKLKSEKYLSISIYVKNEQTVLNYNEKDIEDVTNLSKEELENKVMDLLATSTIEEIPSKLVFKPDKWERISIIVAFGILILLLITLCILFAIGIIANQVFYLLIGIWAFLFAVCGIGIYFMMRTSLIIEADKITYTPEVGRKKQVNRKDVVAVNIISSSDISSKVCFLNSENEVILSFRDSKTVLGKSMFYRTLIHYDIKFNSIMAMLRTIV